MNKTLSTFYLAAFMLFCLSCNGQTPTTKQQDQQAVQTVSVSDIVPSAKTIHVLVALCDNTYQGIVPVPAKIGNGQDPNNNLYWGCGYGIRTYFKKSAEWKLLKTVKQEGVVLERLVFKHATKNYYLVADAYDGQYIKQCTQELLQACAGQLKDTLMLGKDTVGLYGHAKMLSYIGHDGLMDFNLSDSYANADGVTRDCIILACMSRRFFTPHLLQTQATPMVWTTGLMCPEAYTLHDALSGYVQGETVAQVRLRAAKAYAKYQKCGEKAALNLLVSGF